jgi:formylglycine-generating enzyme required for sulfatase activity/tRNA A-37 threonylcarbamoyl transferase component Bud32
MTKLGKYEIIEEIGRGGFGVVYKARDTTLDRIVALKVLHHQLTIDPKFIQRFYHEARTAAGLRHPHVVTIHEVGEEAGQHYLAMEFLPGQPLSQLIESEPLPIEQAVSILEQVAGALDAVHQQGLIHRDVKPSNIRVDEKGQATLLDFGIVRAAEGTRLTTTMAVLGTPEYMAPEQAEIEGGTGIDWRVDVYALGVVAYEILVGRPPFIGRSPTGILYQHIHEPPPRPTTLNPDLPQMLEPVLLKALAKKRDERYRSAGEMVRALEEAAEAESRTRQQEERLAELYRQVQEAVQSEDWAAAEVRCREILALEPEYQDVPELWGQVRDAQARQRELEELYVEAQAKAKRGAWAEVKDLCHRVETLERGYRDVDELLRRAEAELRQRQAEEEQQVHLSQLYRQLQAAAAREDWAEVLNLGGQIRALDAGYRDVSQWVTRARERMQRPKRRPMPAWAWWAAAGGAILVLLGLGVGLGPRLFGTGPAPTEAPTARATELAGAVPTEAPTELPAETPTEEPTAVPTEEPTPAAPPADASLGDTWTRPADGMVMVYVPAGEFEMGSTEGDANEQPVHTVLLDGFWIDRTEVTNAQYLRCVEAGGCSPPPESSSATRDSYYGNSTYDNYPVTKVHWHLAADYCAWAGARLPTEAQWEYAARGPEGRVFPWGDEFDGTRLNYCDANCPREYADETVDDGYAADTAPVGSYPGGASWCGALDMAGNVWEWVADSYGDYPSGRQVNPTGPSSGEVLVLRGGSWFNAQFNARCAFRFDLLNQRSPTMGIRCARGSR